MLGQRRECGAGLDGRERQRVGRLHALEQTQVRFVDQRDATRGVLR